MLKNTCLFLTCLFLLCGPACTQTRTGATYYGRAVKVIDGDTFDLLMDGNQRVRVRLHGIDCPERGMDYYKVAKQELGTRCAGRRLRVVRRDRDQYGRMVADVYTEDNTWLNLEMIRSGLAWHYTRYDSDKRLQEAERNARASRKGLWSLNDPTPPWEWRRAKKAGSQIPQ